MTLTCRTTRQSDKPVRRPCTNILPTFSLLNLIWGHLPVTRCGQLNIWRALSENMENSNLGTRLSCQLLIWFRLNREPREGREISRWWLKPSNQKQNESSRRQRTGRLSSLVAENYHRSAFNWMNMKHWLFKSPNKPWHWQFRAARWKCNSAFVDTALITNTKLVVWLLTLPPCVKSKQRY